MRRMKRLLVFLPEALHPFPVVDFAVVVGLGPMRLEPDAGRYPGQRDLLVTGGAGAFGHEGHLLVCDSMR